jgi:hypothetical protein
MNKIDPWEKFVMKECFKQFEGYYFKWLWNDYKDYELLYKIRLDESHDIISKNLTSMYIKIRMPIQTVTIPEMFEFIVLDGLYISRKDGGGWNTQDIDPKEDFIEFNWAGGIKDVKLHDEKFWTNFVDLFKLFVTGINGVGGVWKPLDIAIPVSGLRITADKVKADPDVITGLI